jgi:phosphoglycolate phosphatase-like HAD superfamily hydrolase
MERHPSAGNKINHLELPIRPEYPSGVLQEVSTMPIVPEPEPTTRKYGLMILDFHGTMTDHPLRAIRSFHRAGVEVLHERLPKEIYQEALSRPSHESGQGETNREFIQRRILQDPNDPRIPDFFQAFTDHMLSTYVPIPGMNSVLRQLASQGLDLALFTNGTNREVIEEILQKWNMTDLHAKLYSSHNTGRKKPDPRTVEHILNDYKTEGKEFDLKQVVMIGDYKDDILTAHNAGVDSILLVRGRGWQTLKLVDPKPTYVISDPQDLPHIIHGTKEPIKTDEVTLEPVLWKREKWGPTGSTTLEELRKTKDTS